MKNYLVLDVECTGKDVSRDKLIGVGVYDPQIDKYHWVSPDYCIDARYSGYQVIGHGTKFELHFLAKENNKLPEKIHCTQTMSYLIDEYPPHTLEYCYNRYVDSSVKWKGLTNKFKKRWKHSVMFRRKWCKRYPLKSVDMTAWEAMHIEWLRDRNEKDCKYTWQVFLVLKKLLGEGNLLDLYNTEIENLWACFHMERRGMKIDKNYFKNLFSKLTIEMEELRLNIQKDLNNDKFNPGSSKQVIELLSGLGHKLPKNKKGNPKADEHVLKGIKTPICKMILKYRNMQKLRKTYAGNYIKKAGDGDIVHPKLNSIGTVSGRYSSDSQQIPKEK